MSEIEEGIDIIEQAEEGIADEGKATEGMDEPEKEKFEEKIEETKEEVSKLSRIVNFFKEYFTKKAAKTFAKFAVKNIAIAAIFFGVEVVLTKLIKQKGNSDKETHQKRLAIVEAIVNLIKAENKMCDDIKKWLDTHKDDTIQLDGISIPLEDIFDEKLKPIADANEEAYDVARPLMSKTSGGKVSFIIPNQGDIHKLLSASESFVVGFGKLRDFVVEKQSQFRALQTLLETLTEAKLGEIHKRIEDIMVMKI